MLAATVCRVSVRFVGNTQDGQRFHSLRERDEFLTYLNDIEASASAEHLQLVEEVYGPDWPTPYIDLLRGNQI